MSRLQGKVALITGGASGIGECSAKLFARHGAKVVIADIQDDLGHSICKEITAGCNEDVTYVHCDVTNDSDVQNAVNTPISKYGRLDIMFCNAGIFGNPDPRISATNNENFKRVFDTNVYGAFLGAKHASRVMIPAKKGSIIYSSSLASVIAGDIPHTHLASKHAIVGLTKSLCAELGEFGIRVNCISPAGIPTRMFKNALGIFDSDAALKAASAGSNLKEVLLEEEDAAEAALFLASDESKYVSGLNLVLDGGVSAFNRIFRAGLETLVS